MPLNSEALLPCPFCGHEAEYALNAVAGDNSMARCRSCGAEAYWRKWNARALQSTPPPPSEDGLPWLVWSNEHKAFWGPNRCGYYGALVNAGRYTRAEAEAICRGASQRANSTIYADEPPEICMPAPEALDEAAAHIEAREAKIGRLEAENARLKQMVRLAWYEGWNHREANTGCDCAEVSGEPLMDAEHWPHSETYKKLAALKDAQP